MEKGARKWHLVTNVQGKPCLVTMTNNLHLLWFICTFCGLISSVTKLITALRTFTPVNPCLHSSTTPHTSCVWCVNRWRPCTAHTLDNIDTHRQHRYPTVKKTQHTPRSSALDGHGVEGHGGMAMTREEGPRRGH